MLILGLIFMVLGFVLAVPFLWTVGIVIAVIGGILWVAQGSGATWGRRWY